MAQKFEPTQELELRKGERVSWVPHFLDEADEAASNLCDPLLFLPSTCLIYFLLPSHFWNPHLKTIPLDQSLPNMSLTRWGRMWGEKSISLGIPVPLFPSHMSSLRGDTSPKPEAPQRSPRKREPGGPAQTLRVVSKYSLLNLFFSVSSERSCGTHCGSSYLNPTRTKTKKTR